jgi:hypothetical protein
VSDRFHAFAPYTIKAVKIFEELPGK